VDHLVISDASSSPPLNFVIATTTTQRGARTSRVMPDSMKPTPAYLGDAVREEVK
jgi:hypothetical protein